MNEWKYCGRFSSMSQDAGPRFTWIDEAEAKRRYHDDAQELTIVPPIDHATGIYPYYIVVTTGEVVSFAVVEQIPPGVVAADTRFLPTTDGRLFLARSQVSQFPPIEQIVTRSNRWALKTAIFENNEDGTGTMLVTEKGEETPVQTQREGILVDELYCDVPAWGQWQTLRVVESASEL